MERKLFVRTVGAGALAALGGGVRDAEAEEVLTAGPGGGTLSVRPGDALVVRLDPEYRMADDDMERLVEAFEFAAGPGVDVLVCSGVVGVDVIRREEAPEIPDAEEWLRFLRRQSQAAAR